MSKEGLPYSKKEVQKLISLIEQDNTHEEIARKLARSVSSVRYQMNKRGLKLSHIAKQRKHREEHKEEAEKQVSIIKQLAARDCYPTEISRKTGIGAAALRRLCAEYGIVITEAAKQRGRERSAYAGGAGTRSKGESLCWHCKNTNLNGCVLFNPAKIKSDGKYIIPGYVKDYKTNSNGVSVRECDRFQSENLRR